MIHTFRGFLTLLIAGILSGCAGSPARIAMMSQEELKSVDSHDLCFAYDMNHSEEIKAELKRRDAIPEKEWALIDQNKINIGMSELGLVCSWGGVGLYGSVNKSVGSWGVHKQWVYRACRSCSANYVYTENGKVKSWQN